jgi:aspartyl-tRNA(Asn)/glutamyl-tRNA(Gln) amidotransferase subunit A
MPEFDSLAAWLCNAPVEPARAHEHFAALLSRAARDNPHLHCYIDLMLERARARARRLFTSDHGCIGLATRWPLFGVPVAVKDNIAIRGLPVSCGSLALGRPPAARDAAIVTRLESSGALLIGRTNMDEAALGASGRNEHFGRCLNPRREGCLSGGSSSGSAAAIAAGHALIGIGTDTLGSVRIPAALCGIVGLKPSHGLLDTRGVTPLYPAFDTLGLLAGSLADARLAMESLAPPGMPGNCAPHLPLRIGCLQEQHMIGCESSVAETYHSLVAALARQPGVQCVPVAEFDFGALTTAAVWEVAASFAARCARAGGRDGFARLLRRVGSELAHLLERALARTQDQRRAGRALLRDGGVFLRDALSGLAGMLTPTCPVTAVDARQALPRSIADFTAAANVARAPAICWPQPSESTGHSVSLQLIGSPGEDLQLLAAAQSVQDRLSA